VYELLKRDGFRVTVVQNPTLSLEGDVEATRLILDRFLLLDREKFHAAFAGDLPAAVPAG
jgi:hypothetical protein